MTRTANLSSCRDVSVDSAAVRRVRLMAGRSHRARKTIATSRECADNGSHAPVFESNLPQKLPCGTVAVFEVDPRRAFKARTSKNMECGEIFRVTILDFLSARTGGRRLAELAIVVEA